MKMKMKHHHFYVVAVSFRSSNPVHRYIVECVQESTQSMSFLSTEEYILKTPEQFYSFEVISEIKDMNANRPWEVQE